MSAFQNTNCPWNIAAPSFVWPARVGDNCYYLQNLVDEIEIIFFQTQGSLQYTHLDLPRDLKNLALDYHLHLPLDLPWEKGAYQVTEYIRRLAALVEYLPVHCLVLHPPADPELFTEFCRAWQNHPQLSGKKLLLENVQDNSLVDIWPRVLQTDFSICLDLGHLIGFNQQDIFDLEGFWDRLEMLHIYGDNYPDNHSSLQNLSTEGQDLLKSVLEGFPAKHTVVLEVFNPEDLKQSLDIFSNWIITWGLS